MPLCQNPVHFLFFFSQNAQRYLVNRSQPSFRRRAGDDFWWKVTSPRAPWLWLRSKSSPQGELRLASGLSEQLCSTAGQFSLVLQPGHKSFYFPQARAPVLYTAHHLIKGSKVTALVKVILPLHPRQRLINTVASRLSAYAASPPLTYSPFNLQSKWKQEAVISLTALLQLGQQEFWWSLQVVSIYTVDIYVLDILF